MKVYYRVYIIICFEDFPHCVLVYHAQCRVYMCTHRPLHTVSRCLPVPRAQLHTTRETLAWLAGLLWTCSCWLRRAGCNHHRCCSSTELRNWQELTAPGRRVASNWYSIASRAAWLELNVIVSLSWLSDTNIHCHSTWIHQHREERDAWCMNYVIVYVWL